MWCLTHPTVGCLLLVLGHGDTKGLTPRPRAPLCAWAITTITFPLFLLVCSLSVDFLEHRGIFCSSLVFSSPNPFSLSCPFLLTRLIDGAWRTLSSPSHLGFCWGRCLPAPTTKRVSEPNNKPRATQTQHNNTNDARGSHSVKGVRVFVEVKFMS